MSEFFDYLFKSISEKESIKNIAISLILIAAIIVFRFIARKTIIKSTLKSEELKQRWLVQVRNLSFLVALFGLMIIWGNELRTLALSLLAITAAIVVATKELILCITGSLYKASSGSFTVGDRITVGTFRGMVADQTLLSTTLFEIGPGMDSHQMTGKTLVIPNALFLTQAIINENNSMPYVLHSFSLKTKQIKFALELEELLRNKLDEISKEHIKPAQKHIKRTFPGKEVDDQTCQPRVVASQFDADTMKFNMRFPIPSSKIGQTEQILIKLFMEWNHDVANRDKKEEKKE